MEADTQWSCRSCTFLNHASLNVCEMCAMPAVGPRENNAVPPPPPRLPPTSIVPPPPPLRSSLTPKTPTSVVPPPPPLSSSLFPKTPSAGTFPYTHSFKTPEAAYNAHSGVGCPRLKKAYSAPPAASRGGAIDYRKALLESRHRRNPEQAAARVAEDADVDYSDFLGFSQLGAAVSPSMSASSSSSSSRRMAKAKSASNILDMTNVDDSDDEAFAPPLTKSSSSSSSAAKKRSGKKRPLERSQSDTTGGGSGSAAKRKKREKKPPPEKRLARRRALSGKVSQRIERAKTQRLYLVHQSQDSPIMRSFAVLGSTGNLYTVKIGKMPSCDCPDAMKGNVCKHVLFVFLKVLKVSEHSEYIYQKALLSTEVEEVFDNAPAVRVGASKQVLDAYENITGLRSDSKSSSSSSSSGVAQREFAGEDCSICFDEMTAGQKSQLVYCRAQCGQSVHRECFEMWERNKKRTGDAVTCVNCRAEWQHEPAAGGGGKSKGKKGRVKKNEGYLNFARQQGLDTERDTDSYSMGFLEYGMYGGGGGCYRRRRSRGWR